MATYPNGHSPDLKSSLIEHNPDFPGVRVRGVEFSTVVFRFEIGKPDSDTPQALIFALKHPNGSFIGLRQENANLGRLGRILTGF